MQERAELELLLMDESALRDAARGAGGGRGAKSLVLPKDDDTDTSKMTKKVSKGCVRKLVISKARLGVDLFSCCRHQCQFRTCEDRATT